MIALKDFIPKEKGENKLNSISREKYHNIINRLNNSVNNKINSKIKKSINNITWNKNNKKSEIFIKLNQQNNSESNNYAL